MRVMGLDVGSKTVGVAVSDYFGWTAQGIETVKINESKEQFGLDRIKELIEEYEVESFVVGLPKNMDGTIGERAEISMEYGAKIEEHFNLPVKYVDERLTTMQANRMLIEEGNTSRKKRKKVIDKLAAVMILQNYLDQQINSKGRN
ncbi:MAG: Holliday junction resolvase RuvX [Alkalibacterium gilvum]|nr:MULTISPECIES: Holliday junction resolvase RuvX [Alkalibacterium]MDN6294192.1 Holliday junction resolvase RuvX [Alkalibacterium sp.]MDN6295773.1 Holliday junction resolvase RuvX [Alkalibacterium sp.]MDN6729891.1 Holliday junction resolvase RuvX [Alkalibacterium sp.]HAJ70243.1 Holliday junction resolvase RuvX [Alkalibacterium sp.]